MLLESIDDRVRIPGGGDPLITERAKSRAGVASSAHKHLPLLFVYGSLRRGCEAYARMRRLGARFAGKGSIRGRLFHLGEFPGAVRARGRSTRVVGELYCLPNAARALRHLDSYEGAAYRREVTEVELLSGRRARAWIYWLKRVPASGVQIVDGDYAKAREDCEF